MNKQMIVITILVVALACGCNIWHPTEPKPFSPFEKIDMNSPDKPVMTENGCRVTAMTRNIYVGTDLNPILAAQDPNQIPLLVANAFQGLMATNFPERSQALAAEVAESKPHLIGLQEVSTVRIQSPGDAVVGGTVPAETVVMDYLEILLQALEARGLNYRVVGVNQNFDVEVPMIVSMNPMAFDDVRLTDYNAVLAREDVEVSDVDARNFQAALPVPDLGITLPQGFIALTATIGNETIRFVNTHLEVEDYGPIQMMQAEELALYLQEETMPILLVGDLNSRAPNGSAYQLFKGYGYLDAWLQQDPPTNDPGYTCSHDADLLNTSVNLDRRIDFILARNELGTAKTSVLGAVSSDVVGDELSDRTPSGLWPSDHAGVIASIIFPGR